jgi:hypothetical protein
MHFSYEDSVRDPQTNPYYLLHLKAEDLSFLYLCVISLGCRIGQFLSSYLAGSRKCERISSQYGFTLTV